MKSTRCLRRNFTINYPSQRGFTLSELLFAMAIIACLLALLTPALKSARSHARAITCVGTLRSIGHAVTIYTNEHNGWLPHSGDASTVNLNAPQKCWKAFLAPYLGVTSVNKYNCERKAFWCAAQNNASCGNATYGDNGFYGGYGWNFNHFGWRDTVQNGVIPPWVNILDVAAPAAKIMAGDTSDFYVGSATIARVFYLYRTAASGEDWATMSARHHGGGNYLWADGHVSWQSAQEAWNRRDDWFPLP
ncbi:MAG: type II secretion system protein [Verrucomicrobiae bacterium]|nr:type II secretion system protein [Verrucomicrobiae bacterium]